MDYSKEWLRKGPGFEPPPEELHFVVPLRVPKVNEIFINLEIDLAKGEHLNFSLAHRSHLSVIRYI